MAQFRVRQKDKKHAKQWMKSRLLNVLIGKHIERGEQGFTATKTQKLKRKIHRNSATDSPS